MTGFRGSRVACAIGIGILAVGLARAVPDVTIRVASIDAFFADVQAITQNPAMSRSAMLTQAKALLGVDDLSFCDFSQPLAIAFQEKRADSEEAFAVALPVRDAHRALDALAVRFPNRTTEGDLTVLSSPGDALMGMSETRVYALVRGRILVMGSSADVVRSLDTAAVLSAEGLPPGSAAISMEVESRAEALKASLQAMRRVFMEIPTLPSGAVPPSAGGAAEDESGEATGEDDEDADAGNGPEGGAVPESGAVDPSGARAGAGTGQEPMLVVGDVVPPNLVTKTVPDYPEEARRHSVQGKVILEAIIDIEGKVENVRVLKSIPELDQAAIDAVKQWKYEPARKDGVPVKVFFTVVVDFSLSPSPGGAPETVAQPGEAPAPAFDAKKMAPVIDLYLAFLDDAIDSLSRLQVSFEVANGYLVVHGRGVARDRSELARFITAQRDVGLPTIGRMMPSDAALIAAGQLYWTDPARAWMGETSKRFQSAMADVLPSQSPNADGGGTARPPEATLVLPMDCMRGDVAVAADPAPDGMRILQVAGVSDSKNCRGSLGRMVASAKEKMGSAATVRTDVLQPEKVKTFVQVLKVPRFDGAASMDPPERTMRYAQVGNLVISGTDPWASKAIREAAAAQDGSPPGRGGLVLADLGPFTQRPGVFGRIQMGSYMRQLRQSKASAEAVPEAREKLLQSLEGQAGSIPFAMRFDEGAATLEFAFPLGMFEALRKASPARPPATRD